jgi:hypothetical protein
MPTQRTDEQLAAWMNSAEYARREAILDDLAAQGQMPSVEGVAILLDLPLDITLGLVRAVLDYEERGRCLQ